MESDHQLRVVLGYDDDFEWAQDTVKQHHYLHQYVLYKQRPMLYVIKHVLGHRLGLMMLGIPHATRCRGWWGYKGLITQWQVLDLCRVWLDPWIQTDGLWCVPGSVPGYTDRKGMFRSTAATWAIGEVLDMVQRDRIRRWPPVLLDQPYHIRLVISYHDPCFHRGTIYREAKATPMYTSDGQPVPGPSGKYGWCWPLAQPDWHWQDLVGIKPRTIRMF